MEIFLVILNMLRLEKKKTREILQTLGATLAITSTALGIYEMLRKNFFRKTATEAVKDIAKQ